MSSVSAGGKVRQQLNLQDMYVDLLRSQLKDSVSEQIAYTIGWSLGKGMRDEIWVYVGAILSDELMGI